MKRRHLPTLGVSVIALAGLIALTRTVIETCPEGESRNGLTCVDSNKISGRSEPSSSQGVIAPNIALDQNKFEGRFSIGDRILFTAEGNPDSEAGASAISSQDYTAAISSFENAVSSGRNNPEPQIYLNNAIARQKGKPYTLAAVVPVDNNSNAAQDILRGIADAQTAFNQSGGVDNRLLEIMIVNDGNKPEFAAAVAERLANDSNMLGVIGHNSSSASLKALPVYESAGLPMISPTSTSTELDGSVFFRTVPSDSETGRKLADYMEANSNIESVSIFYDSNSSYSKSLKQAFISNFDGDVAKEIDLAEGINFDSEIESVAADVSTVLLFPSTATVSRAIGIARANLKLPPDERVQLLGGDALYKSETLTDGGQAVEGMVLAVPWFANTDYAERAEDRWGGRVSWRTASSYDATIAFTQALSGQSGRDSVLSAVRETDVSSSMTSGDQLSFNEQGNRIEEPILVRTVQGGNGPANSKFGFEELSE